MPESTLAHAIPAGDQETVEQELRDQPDIAHGCTEQGISWVLLAMYMRQPYSADVLAAARSELSVHEAVDSKRWRQKALEANARGRAQRDNPQK